MEKSSFFNSVNGDRKYNAESFASYFSKFIGNGVFPNPSTNLQIISDASSMNLILKPGAAWINGYMYENTDNLSLPIESADGALNRIDRVVVRLSYINREIRTYIKKGEYGSSPFPPTLQRDSDVYEIALADISVKKGVIKITQADISDLRTDTNLCGLVSGVVTQIDTKTLLIQMEQWFENSSTDFETKINSWFEEVKTLLDDSIGTALTNELVDARDGENRLGDNIRSHKNSKASASVLGHVKSGVGVKIDNNGVLSVADNVQQYKLTQDNGVSQLATGDWNSYKSTGFYRGSNMANQPPAPAGSDSSSRWSVIVQTDGNNVMQIAVEYATGIMFTRIKYDNTNAWSSWQSYAPGGYGLGMEATVAISDWNNYTKTGFYRGSNLSHQPPAPVGANASNWWYVTVVRHDTNYLMQVAYEYATGTSYRRQYYNGSWGNWEQNGQQYPLTLENGLPLAMPSTNFNDITTSGYYFVSGTSFTNGPASSLYGVVQVVGRLNNGGCTQTYISNGNGFMYIRGTNDGVNWSSWDGVAMRNFDFAVNNGPNGYQKLPSGIIMQWCVLSAVTYNTLTTINLPTAFPTVLINAWAQLGGGALYNGNAGSASVSNGTKTSVQVIHDYGTTGTSRGIVIFAIGY